jgi:hypothetical protein
MKKTTFLTAASLAALMAASPALVHAADANMSGETTMKVQANNPDTPPAETVTEQDIREGWNDTKKAAKDTYKDVKAAILDKTSDQPVNIDNNTTVQVLLGQPIYSHDKQKIATLEDIILDADGTAKMVVVKDLGLLGFGGKLAAFDYGTVVKTDAKGNIVTPLSKSAIDSAAEFSYTPEKTNAKIRMIPDNGYSVAQMLDGKLRGADNKSVADIDNIAFNNGKASMVIASYGGVLNMGEEHVALDFDSAQLVRADGSVDLKLDANETKAFEKLKKAPKAE